MDYIQSCIVFIFKCIRASKSEIWTYLITSWQYIHHTDNYVILTLYLAFNIKGILINSTAFKLDGNAENWFINLYTIFFDFKINLDH